MIIQTIRVNDDLRIRIEQDTDAESPGEWDNVGEIAYNSHRETLGTENVSRDRLGEIAREIENGSLIGLPVYAYVHSGATIRCAPFNCPRDSGQSGFVYTTKVNAIREFGKKIATQAVIERTLKCLRGEVETFNQWLTGDVYGYIVERRVTGGWDGVDSCWGFFGLECCISEAEGVAAHYAKDAVGDCA